MRECRVVPVWKGQGPEFLWEWQSASGDERSERSFVLFHDCLEDAKRQGFEVVLDKATGDMAPGRYALSN